MNTEAIEIEAGVAKAEALAEKDHAIAFVIDSAEQYRVAVETLKQLAAKSREIDEKRKGATRPLDEAKKTILEWWRPAVDNLSSAIDSLRKAIAKYDAARAERERAAAAQMVTAISNGATEAVKATIAEVFAPNDTGVRYKTSYKFEVVDFAALPEEYKQVNETKLGAVVRALKETAEQTIPGIKVSTTKTPY